MKVLYSLSSTCTAETTRMMYVQLHNIISTPSGNYMTALCLGCKNSRTILDCRHAPRHCQTDIKSKVQNLLVLSMRCQKLPSRCSTAGCQRLDMQTTQSWNITHMVHTSKIVIERPTICLVTVNKDDTSIFG